MGKIAGIFFIVCSCNDCEWCLEMLAAILPLYHKSQPAKDGEEEKKKEHGMPTCKQEGTLQKWKPYSLV